MSHKHALNRNPVWPSGHYGRHMVAQLAEFIRKEVWAPRLKKQGCLVVYDPADVNKELCSSLDSGSVRLVEASESSIESRAAAIQALADLGNPKTKLEG